jgi:hypothetical protein
MTDLRTLPIRLEPLEGEALDSWFEALAHRMRMPAGILLAALGLQRYTANRPEQTNWMVMLQHHEAEGITLVTGVDESRLASMTLAAYDGRALAINRERYEVNRNRLWGRNAGSRFCPQCLAETEGRWSLSWRLGWSFACLRHGCLLLDACPTCHRTQRVSGYLTMLLRHPAYCSYPAPGSSPAAKGSSREARCGTDLRRADSVRFGSDHPVLSAQRLIHETVEAGQAAFGIYVGDPVAARSALADVKAIATRALESSSADALARRLPDDFVPIYRESMAQLRSPRGARSTYATLGHMAPPRSAIVAAGVVAAARILGHPTVEQAGHALRWLTVDARARGRVVNPSTAADWGRGMSPALNSASLVSLKPVMRPSHKLRHRVMTVTPGPVGNPGSRLDSLARSTPSLLWPSWTVRLAPGNVSARFIRGALSAFLLLPGTRATLREATAKLGGTVNEGDASRILQVIEDGPQCEDILAALTRISDHLADVPAPINYERRRCLDYSSLLADSEWRQICRDTCTIAGSGRRVHVARAYLRQRLSTLPQDDPPPSPTGSRPTEVSRAADFRSELAEFPVRMFPELKVALDTAGHIFLARHGITDEPVTWQPPLGLVSGLELPGPDPAGLDTRGLHQMIYAGNAPGKAGQAIGISTDAVRLILDEHPAPALRVRRHRGSLAGQATEFAGITKEDLERLYLHERLPIRQIAARYHTSRPAIADVLRAHGIAIGHRPPPGMTADWLQQEYVEKSRSLAEIAREIGISHTGIKYWAKKYGIPIRSRGNRTSSSRYPAK